MLRFGTATQALTEARARLAVTEAVEAERARLAREMHDSVAKTLHGLALAADGLAALRRPAWTRSTVKHQAELVARSARRAAAESRELLSDLRRESGPGRQASTSLAELRRPDATTSPAAHGLPADLPHARRRPRARPSRTRSPASC